MPSAAIYSRLSRDRTGLSPNCQIQTEEAREYAQAQNYEVVAQLADNDISASKYSTKPRPGFNRLIEAIRRGEVEIILATEMTRLYRQLPQLLELIKLAETTNLKRIETTEGQVFLLHTGEGIHAAIASINNAQLESRKISDRGKRKKRAQAKLGLPGGGDRSFGYNWGHMTVNEEEATVVREMAARILNGESISCLTADLNERGIKTTRGNAWVRNRLTSMIINPRYIGIRVHRDEQYPAQWPVILDKDMQDLVKLELRSRVANRERRGGPRRYLGTGFYVCGRCGNKLHCSQSRRDSSQPLKATYTCRGKDNHEIRVGCDGISRNGLALDDFVVECMLYRLDSEGLAQTLSVMSEDKSHLGELMADIERRAKKLNDLTDDYAIGLLDRAQYARAKGIATDALEAVQALLNKEMQSRTIVNIPLAQTLRETWETADLEWRRSLLMMMIDRVIVNPQLKRPVYKDFGRFDPGAVEIVWTI
ncbi:recombinase family protein [Nakamurella sp. PAMC28650]|uniref:recombinase family protein n=1 Tax=Nakamurella sp. PAMC28650 TaxID=2762325 RepID=UPI00164D784E|nr:recombinase family protein [Nakamurella sp. PAMC28650]QNK82614.1 recombinase family protein [Nakamurella sp. PAMC28650]